MAHHLYYGQIKKYYLNMLYRLGDGSESGGGGGAVVCSEGGRGGGGGPVADRGGLSAALIRSRLTGIGKSKPFAIFTQSWLQKKT